MRAIVCVLFCVGIFAGCASSQTAKTTDQETLRRPVRAAGTYNYPVYRPSGSDR